MELNVKNMSRTLLTQDIGLTETSFKVADAEALPNPPFLITVEGEIMRVGSKNVSTNTLSNVLRGQEGTSPAPHSSGTVVENRFTAGTYDEIKQTVTSYNDALTSHLAENVTDAGGVHGLQIEEGEWTPQIISSDGGEGEHSVAYGSYVAIGRLVYVQFSVGLSNKGTLSTSTGGIRIAGLPFTISGYSGNDIGAVTFSSIQHVTYPENAIRIYGTLSRTRNYISLSFERNGGSSIDLIPEHLGNASYFRGAFVYKRVI